MKPKKPARIGARTIAALDSKVLAQLEKGTLETANLTEGLALNMATLLAAVAPNIPKNAINLELGVVQRMAAAGAALRAHNIDLAKHTSDTVRGWAAFAVGQDEKRSAKNRLLAMKEFAADSHFGVREWAWMAVRALVVSDPLASIEILQPWTRDKDANVRRFVSELTRPRGVWAASIPLLRKEPMHALSLLTALNKDESQYVEDSVANWLNDAGKDQPQWVTAVLTSWKREGVSSRLLLRAGRNL
jgi:3-methyladenine DNA glycosylase AlkC